MPRPPNLELPQRILDIAERTVEAHGHHSLNMRALASELEITATTIYRYFTDRDDLIEAVRLRAADRLNARISAIDSRTDEHEVIRRIGHEYISFAEEHPNLYRLLFQQIGNKGFRPNRESRDRLYLTYDTARSALSRLAKEEPHPVDPAYGAMLGWIMLHGFCSLLISGRLAPAEDLDTETLKEIFLTAYASGGFAHAPPRA